MKSLKLSIKDCVDKRTNVTYYSCEIIIDDKQIKKLFINSFDNSPEYVAAQWLVNENYIQRNYALHSYCNKLGIDYKINHSSVKNINKL